MSLEEEITINQFGQGVRSGNEMLALFSQLDDYGKQNEFYALYSLVANSPFSDADISQALLAGAFSDTYRPCLTVHKRGYRAINMSGAGVEDDYTFLLYLFKATYQRQFELAQGNTTEWQYRDLSSSEIVGDILTTHRLMIETVYTNPGFRNEFISLAKLWHNRHTQTEAPPQGPQQPDFITYDELMTKSALMFDNKNMRGFMLLSKSLTKALSVRYGLAADHAERLLMDVIGRHEQETYPTGLL